MSECTSYERDGEVAILSFDNPPVNLLSPAVVAGLEEGVRKFSSDSAGALLIYCRGRTFFAGGDIMGFSRPDFSTASFNDLLARMERLDRPVIAAMHGTVMGGGVELALACHYRVATAETQFGLPEILLGLIPGSLGTQRLPRLVGIRQGLDWMSTGRMVHASEALRCGLVDALIDRDSRFGGLAVARRLLQDGAAPLRLSDRRIPPASVPSGFFEQALQDARNQHPEYPAQEALVHAVEASLLPFEEGDKVESRLFDELRRSPQSRAMRYQFLAERAATKTGAAESRRLKSIGILSGLAGDAELGERLVSCGIDVKQVQRPDADPDDGIDELQDRDAILATHGFDDLQGQTPGAGRVIHVNIVKPPRGRPVAEVLFDENRARDADAVAQLLRRAGYLPVVCRSSLIGPLLQACRAETGLRVQGGTAEDINAAFAMAGFAWNPLRMRAHEDFARGPVSQSAVREAIAQRMLNVLADAGARLVQERAAVRSSDIDVVCRAVLGFPEHRGGPMFMAGQEGSVIEGAR